MNSKIITIILSISSKNRGEPKTLYCQINTIITTCPWWWHDRVVCPNSTSNFKPMMKPLVEGSGQLLMYDIPKAGSSTWLRVFGQLNGVWDSVKELGSWSRPMMSQRAGNKLLSTAGSKTAVRKNQFRFTFVRHPFTRLASGYEEKILTGKFKIDYKVKWVYFT